MRRILLTLALAVSAFSAYADDGHTLWLGDFMNWDPEQLRMYWQADSFDYAIDESLPK